MPLLEILTRTYKRPELLKRNRASLEAMIGDDCIQMLLVDEIGRGVPWANANLDANADKLTGDYIWVLDDDDICIHPRLLDDIREITSQFTPDVIMVLGEFPTGILPDAGYWLDAPALGHIGMPNFIVRREVFQRHSHAFADRMIYAADFDFIAEVFKETSAIYWHNVVAFAVDAWHHGRSEEQIETA